MLHACLGKRRRGRFSWQIPIFAKRHGRTQSWSPANNRCSPPTSQGVPAMPSWGRARHALFCFLQLILNVQFAGMPECKLPIVHGQGFRRFEFQARYIVSLEFPKRGERFVRQRHRSCLRQADRNGPISFRHFPVERCIRFREPVAIKINLHIVSASPHL